MKALRVLFAILLSLVLFCLQTALLSLFVADRLVSPSALTTAIEGSGLVDSIVEDTLTDMGMDASAADPAPLNAYAGELVSGVVTALVRGGERLHHLARAAQDDAQIRVLCQRGGRALEHDTGRVVAAERVDGKRDLFCHDAP